MAFSEALSTLLSGDVAHAILSGYTGYMGLWFYFFVYAMLVLPIYFKTQSIVMPLFLTIIMSAVGFGTLPPEVHAYVALFGALGIAGILYIIFKGKGDY